MRKRSSGFPTRSDTNRAVRTLNIAGGLKFGIQKVKELYYPCNENKGAQLICVFVLAYEKKPVFSQ